LHSTVVYALSSIYLEELELGIWIALGLMKENGVFCACISVAHLASARRKFVV
jgi:hypothetical protein